jgi:hypothetical protein
MSEAFPNNKTLQAFCPLNSTKILAMCSTYGMTHNSIGPDAITCYTEDNSTCFGCQIDGPTPSGWIIYNYSTPNCTFGGWVNQ